MAALLHVCHSGDGSVNVPGPYQNLYSSIKSLKFGTCLKIFQPVSSTCCSLLDTEQSSTMFLDEAMYGLDGQSVHLRFWIASVFIVRFCTISNILQRVEIKNSFRSKNK